MKKKGFTPAGRQRWYCASCRYSPTSTRTDKARHAQFTQFTDYVTDTLPQRALQTSSSQWQRDHAWCWQTRPVWEPTGEVHDQVFLDGTYTAYKWCIITASTRQGVVSYQPCDTESKASYTALLERIPAPRVVVTDGHKGALAAIRQCWPQTKIQRCLVHVQRQIRRVTTLRPKTIQHRALRQLGLSLTAVKTFEQAMAWQRSLRAFHELYDTWLNERTYRDQVPASQVPKRARNNKSWWYTHGETRSMIKALDRHVKDGVLFTFLRTDLDVSTPLAATTNALEGGINAPLKNFLHAHRGWTENHMLTAIDYYLYAKSLNARPLTDFINNIITTTPDRPNEQPGPVEIDHHIDQQAPWEDGLTIRKGWGGRSN